MSEIEMRVEALREALKGASSDSAAFAIAAEIVALEHRLTYAK